MIPASKRVAIGFRDVGEDRAGALGGRARGHPGRARGRRRASAGRVGGRGSAGGRRGRRARPVTAQLPAPFQQHYVLPLWRAPSPLRGRAVLPDLRDLDQGRGGARLDPARRLSRRLGRLRRLVRVAPGRLVRASSKSAEADFDGVKTPEGAASRPESARGSACAQDAAPRSSRGADRA